LLLGAHSIGAFISPLVVAVALRLTEGSLSAGSCFD